MSLVLANTGFAQSQNSMLQQRSITELKKYFSPAIISKLSCQLFTLRGKEHDDQTTGYACDALIDSNLLHAFYAFQYRFFSTQLEDSVYFVVALDAGSIKENARIVHRIPECVRKDSSCKLVTRAKAISIVLQKGYLPEDGNLISMEKNKLDDQFYWLIPAVKIARRPTYTRFKTFYLNIVTGQLIPDSKFKYYW
ncbi:MAG: hypothetical protein JWQ27_375 [Ferruginibacter sp.]|nr:hypothetical protein [Ferruginibacter sp.]